MNFLLILFLSYSPTWVPTPHDQHFTIELPSGSQSNSAFFPSISLNLPIFSWTLIALSLPLPFYLWFSFCLPSRVSLINLRALPSAINESVDAENHNPCLCFCLFLLSGRASKVSDRSVNIPAQLSPVRLRSSSDPQSLSRVSTSCNF